MYSRDVLKTCFCLLMVIRLSYGDDNIIFEIPPIIDTNYTETVVTVGRNITLICYGKQPITWLFPENTMSASAEDSVKLVDVTDIPGSDYPYGLKLEIIEIIASDVGFYTCSYNTSDVHEEEPEELVKQGKATSVYVFVDDPDALMVPTSIMVISGKQYQEIILPCKPTAPNVYVELYLKDADTITKVPLNREIDKLSGRKVTYDRQTGFHIPELEMSDATYFYECIFQRDGRNDSAEMIISVTPFTSSVPKPQISDNFNGNAVIGGVINLECNVRVDSGIYFDIYWSTPKNYTGERLHISKTSTKSQQLKSNLHQNFGVSKLTLTNITKDDEGIYRCEIRDTNDNNNHDSMRIHVRDVGESFINLTEHGNVHKLSVAKGKFVKWVIQVNAFPIPEITWYDNKNNKILAPWTEPHIAKAETKTAANHKDTAIFIQNLELSDAGVYKVRATNEYDVSKQLNLTLIVTAPPSVHFVADEFHLINTSVQLYCKVESFPLSKVTWHFQNCLTMEECVKVPKKEISNALITKKEFNYTTESYLTMYVNKSGLISCTAMNRHGKDSKTRIFLESEVNGGFGIIKDDTITTIGDNVVVACVLSRYKNMSDNNLHWYHQNSTTPIGEDDFERFRVKVETTPYSTKLLLLIQNANFSHSGQYTCRAEYNETMTYEDVINIDVKDTVHPKIVKSNLNNTDIYLRVGMPNQVFDCFAEGIPIPKIQWFKDSVPIIESKDKRISIVNVGKTGRQLRISYIQEDDYGQYMCKVTNRVGNVSKYINIKLSSQIKLEYIAPIIVLAVIFIALILYLVWRIRKEKRIRKELSLAGLLHFDEGDTNCLNPELGVDEQADLLPYDKKWEFPRESLKLGTQLGSGAFGVVMKAKAYEIIEGEEMSTVAVKMVKKTADAAFIKALASELKIMVHLGKHLNVVNLLGACTNNVTKRELLVIVEYCRYGNIHNYLLRHRGNFIDQVDHSTDIIDGSIGGDHINRAFSVSSNRSGTGRDEMNGESTLGSNGPNSPNMDTNNTVMSTVLGSDIDGITSNGSVQPEWRSNYKGDYNYNKNSKPISTQDLVCWAFQVARGMEYLASRKVLHGDLAARNILLADDNIVKICDFGLAKSMYKSDNYKKKGDGPLPVKWMAIESIRDRVFSTQSDVWSFGIVLWEMFSLAKTPYPGMDADEKFYNRLIKGYRMEKPEYANKQIYQIMLECWRGQPIQRPNFTELAQRLGNMLEDGVKNLYIDLNNPYMDMNNKWLTEKGNNDYLAMMSAPDYGNMVSISSHQYVNDPFGGSTKVNPLSPDDTDDEGYLRMLPTNNGVVVRGSPIFNFDVPTPKEDEVENGNELIPMLTVNKQNQRLDSVSDVSESYPTSPKSPITPNANSYSNPSYQPMIRITEPILEENGDDSFNNDDRSYVKMSQKDSGFIDSIDINAPSDYPSLSYVNMTGNKNVIPPLYNNLPSTKVT